MAAPPERLLTPMFRVISRRAPDAASVAWWLGSGPAVAAAHTTIRCCSSSSSSRAGSWPRSRDRRGERVPSVPPAGAAAIVLRVALVTVLGGIIGRTVLFRLPRSPCPSGWPASAGGPVSAEALVAAAVEGLRLATTLAASARPTRWPAQRLLRYLRRPPRRRPAVRGRLTAPLRRRPGWRVRAARRLRGHSGSGSGSWAVSSGRCWKVPWTAPGPRGVDGVPRLRPYPGPVGVARRASALTLTGLVGVVGLYGLLDGSVTGLLGCPSLCRRASHGGARRRGAADVGRGTGGTLGVARVGRAV